MGDSDNVKMGACNVTFGAADLGYTKGGVKVSYATESAEITVDQEDAPIGEVLTKQTFTVTVPMAEYDLAKLEDILPGAALYEDGTMKKLILSGAAGQDLLAMAKALTVIPVGGTANDGIYVPHAVPQAKIEFAFEKENVRVYEVTFKAMKGSGGFVVFGDMAAIGIASVTPASGAQGGGTDVTIKGTGFTGANVVKFNTTVATSIVVVDDSTITCKTPAGTGTVGVTVGKNTHVVVKPTAFTYTA